VPDVSLVQYFNETADGRREVGLGGLSIRCRCSNRRTPPTSRKIEYWPMEELAVTLTSGKVYR
jgi:hypothetical protein